MRLDEAPKIKRLPAIVSVIQDRVTLNDEKPRAFHRGGRNRAAFRQGQNRL